MIARLARLAWLAAWAGLIVFIGYTAF